MKIYTICSIAVLFLSVLHSEAAPYYNQAANTFYPSRQPAPQLKSTRRFYIDNGLGVLFTSDIKGTDELGVSGTFGTGVGFAWRAEVGLSLSDNLHVGIASGIQRMNINELEVLGSSVPAEIVGLGVPVLASVRFEHTTPSGFAMGAGGGLGLGILNAYSKGNSKVEIKASTAFTFMYEIKGDLSYWIQENFNIGLDLSFSSYVSPSFEDLDCDSIFSTMVGGSLKFQF